MSRLKRSDVFIWNWLFLLALMFLKMTMMTLLFQESSFQDL